MDLAMPDFTSVVPQEGFEPPTSRLRSGCSTTELLRRAGQRGAWIAAPPWDGKLKRLGCRDVGVETTAVAGTGWIPSNVSTGALERRAPDPQGNSHMAKFRIVTTKATTVSTGLGGYTYEMEALKRLGVEIIEVAPNEAEFIQAARDADAVYAKGMKFTSQVINALDKCRVISLGSVGVDTVDVGAATAKGIPVTNCPDTFIEEVADHAMMLLLACHRRVIEQDRIVREGRWTEGRPHLLKVPRLMGSTLGFIAFGRVARATARRAKAFGLHIIAHDPFVDEQTIATEGAEPASLDEVLARSDFISMHMPATPEAQAYLGEKQFQKMKRTAIFINTGRGPTVKEAGLIKALQEGWIAGAGLDVFEVEPIQPDNPLIGMKNVILSPHNASASARFDPARRRRVGQEIANVLSGRWPLSCVNPTVLPTAGLKRWQPISMERGPNS